MTYNFFDKIYLIYISLYRMFHVKTEPSSNSHFNLIAQQQKGHHLKAIMGEKNATLPAKQQVVMATSMSRGKKYPVGSMLFLIIFLDNFLLKYIS